MKTEKSVQGEGKDGSRDSHISLDGVKFWIEDEGIRIQDFGHIRHLNHAEGEQIARWFYAWYLAKRPYPAPETSASESVRPKAEPSPDPYCESICPTCNPLADEWGEEGSEDEAKAEGEG